MTALAKGIAHVSSPGGGIFLPARTPYDRETLVEYVAHNVHAQGRGQVLVEEQRWLVDCRGVGRPPVSCTGCGHVLEAACCAATDASTTPYCLKCAFATEAEAALPDYEPHRQAS
jgi:hypothetical protein